MCAEAASTTLDEFLATLQADPDEIPWGDRRELVHVLDEALAAAPATDTILAIVHLLAGDPKWEVRAAVAGLLPLLPDDDLTRLGAQLAADTNSYVHRAAARALERRRRNSRQVALAQRSSDQVNEQLHALESQFGKAAVAKAVRACGRYGEHLAGAMVHDLRNILTHLKSNCFSLIDEVNGRASRRAAKVRADLEYLERVVGDMEAFTQPVPADRQPERLADVVTAALEMAQDNVRRCRLDPDAVAMHVDVPPSLFVEMARHQLVLALANVVKNAYEAFATGNGRLRSGRIDVWATANGSHVDIKVKDDGMGIVEEETTGPFLFMPGRRNKSKHFSTGYGLAITSRNLEAHGGTLVLDSRENEGTTVTMTLPLTGRDGEMP